MKARNKTRIQAFDNNYLNPITAAVHVFVRKYYCNRQTPVVSEIVLSTVAVLSSL